MFNRFSAPTRCGDPRLLAGCAECQDHGDDEGAKHAKAARDAAESASMSATKAAEQQKSAQEHILHLTSRIDELESANKALHSKTLDIEERLGQFNQATGEISAKADAAVEEGMRDMKAISGVSGGVLSYCMS